MKVGYSYLNAQFKDYRKIFDKIAKVIESGDFTLGKALEAFEREFAALIGTKYAVGVNSGTDALFLSLKALGIGPGDEVITAPNTFIATVGAIVAAGATPVYVDVNDEFVIDADRIEDAITPRTRAILPVHYSGAPADMDRIMAIARRHGLPVVEDACQAISAAVSGRCVGTFGATGGFSLHPLKNLNVWGDSGMIVTDSQEIRDRLVLLRNHGLKTRDVVDIYGYNSRMDTIQAVVGSHLIKDVQWITETRIKWAGVMDEALSELEGDISIPPRLDHKRYVYHLYMVVARKRDALLKHLQGRGIEAKVHYPIPMHLQPCAFRQGYKEGDFPATEAQAKSQITFPVHQHLTRSQVDYMIREVRAFYKSGKSR